MDLTNSQLERVWQAAISLDIQNHSIKSKLDKVRFYQIQEITKVLYHRPLEQILREDKRQRLTKIAKGTSLNAFSILNSICHFKN